MKTRVIVLEPTQLTWNTVDQYFTDVSLSFNKCELNSVTKVIGSPLDAGELIVSQVHFLFLEQTVGV